MPAASTIGTGSTDGLAPLALLVNLQTASVPGFAPVGLDAERYGTEAFGDAPVPEFLHHRLDQHAGIERLSDLASDVDDAGMDVADIVAIAVELGAGEVVAIATDPDGGTWPIAERLLGAARDAGLRTGLALDPARDAATLIATLAPDTIRRLGDGRVDAKPAGESIGDGPVVVDPRTEVPDTETGHPWELRLGVGPSLGWNRAETIEDLRTPRQLVDRFARTLARGGRLLLDLPIRPDGTPSPMHLEAIRSVAPWFTRHAETLRGFGRFDVDGDDTVRYLAKPGPEKGRRTIAIIDLTAGPSRSIAHFSPHRYPVLEVEGATTWSQDPGGVHLDGLAADGLPNLVVLTVTDRRQVRLSVQGRRTPGTVTIDGRSFGSIGNALAAVSPGQTIEIGPGRFGPETESFPLHVPSGVRVLGPVPPDVPAEARKHLPEPPAAELVGPGTLVHVDGPDVEVHHLHLTGTSTDVPVLSATGAHGLLIENVEATGRLRLDQVDDAIVQWTNVDQGGIELHAVHRATVRGGRIVGSLGQRPAIEVRDADDVRIEAVAVTEAFVAVDLVDVRAVRISACALLARQAAVHVDGGRDIEVSGNRLRAMRGVHVRNGRSVQVRINGVERVDTFVLVDGDPLDVVVDGNRVATARQEFLAVPRREPDASSE